MPEPIIPLTLGTHPAIMPAEPGLDMALFDLVERFEGDLRFAALFSQMQAWQANWGKGGSGKGKGKGAKGGSEGPQYAAIIGGLLKENKVWLEECASFWGGAPGL